MLVYQDEHFLPHDLYAMITIYVIVMFGYLMKIGYRCYESIQTDNSLSDKDLEDTDFSDIKEGGESSDEIDFKPVNLKKHNGYKKA